MRNVPMENDNSKAHMLVEDCSAVNFSTTLSAKRVLEIDEIVMVNEVAYDMLKNKK